jgi:hypothetical protein
LNDVEKALTTKVIPTDVARAMTNARRRKIEKLLAELQAADPVTLASLPESN